MEDHLRRRPARAARRLPRRGLGLTALLMLLAATACNDGAVPAALLGRWTSPDPRYEGRSLAISPATIAFGIDAATQESFLIERVDSETGSEGGTLHAVHYRGDDGQPRSIRIELLASRGPALRLENHEELWVREGSAPGAPGGGE